MAVHWVNNDPNKSGQDYAKLIEYLKSFGTWAKPLKSSFFIKTSMTSAELQNGIKQHINSNDDVVVIPIDGRGWASCGLRQNITEWMKNNL